MSTRSLTLVLGVLVGLLALTAGILVHRLSDDRSGSALATAVDFGGPFELTDYNGDTITQAAFEGQPSLLFFGFTFCPDVCPTTVYEIEGWLEELGPEADEVKAFFVTVDPERDTPEILGDYLKPQTDRVIGISGAPQAVWDMARSWRVYWAKRPLGEGDYTLDHFASVYVLDDKGQLFDKISYGAPADEAVAKIRAALRN